ncbi:NAD(P)/FAD-dependent oxidoreductase [Paractinoplanes lichenicola]|uniref:FAD-dependent oxidoreductase n=1 Tax=Paractinoplanes lichenicola TaxID=2802976 RepID=A0ABS1VKY1_9ACTN|nr:FAD-dependent oxidoreductase [Actinoplanes lichenicola]MBL7255371.1 FAD-dependent oxidoreductase [Actinoplanes lichenicola]
MTDIVILGAGYAGLAAATNLAGRTRKREDVRITLVNAAPRFTERLRLHSTAAGHATADFDLAGLAATAGFTFIPGWITAVDAGARTVRVDDERTLHFDTLVWALGSTADTSDVPGAAEHAYTLDSFADAQALAARLNDLHTGTVLVCGTGLTGVETAAEIAERHPHLTVHLRGRDEPGATLTPKARSYLQGVLTRLDVRVETGADIVKVLPDDADVIVWTAGTRVSPLAAAAGLAVDERGRIVTDPVLRSTSHPHVYAVGDAAAVRQRYGIMHGTCQGGMPTGVHAAQAIARELDGREPRPFRFGYYHAPISLGRRDAVVQFTHPDDSPRRGYLTGRAAVWYKETVSASPWPTYARMLKQPGLASWWPRGGRFTR